VRRRRVAQARLRALLAGASFATVAVFAFAAFARPGGGEEYGGGSLPSFSTDSGGDGGGDVDVGLIIELIYLCFKNPPLGIGALVVVGGFYYVKGRMRRGLKDWSTALPAPVRVQAPTRSQGARAKLSALRGEDPAFSLILFEDFAYALYAELQVSRARGGIGRLAAFLNPEVARLLHDPSLERVDGVVIGALRYLDAQIGAERVQVTLEVEANLSEVRAAGAQRYYVKDRVTLARARSARSRPPARVRKLDCPNCGAPLEGMRGTTCGYCRTEVGGGRLDWLVDGLQRLATEARPPLATGDAPERGNQLPTLVAPGCQERLAGLGRRDPAHDPAALWARIGLIFNELQIGWSNRDLSRIRPFVSDNLFQYFGFWIDAYVANGARNLTENARVSNIELAEVSSDAVYDAVTVRVSATGLDYTLAVDGRVLRGSRSKERPYTEYWTLVRGSAARGRPRTEPICPCCGAPLKIGMAGNCEYCSARVVSGEFDWVLSRIEQDEAYGG
jgi:hypothetical protein